MSSLRFAFAGDRDIGVWVLDYLLSLGHKPLALLVPDAARASHAEDLISLCDFLGPRHILRGTLFRKPEGIALLGELNLDYILCIHFPYVVPRTVLSVPRIGVLNLHPAFLPFNRGWHTPTWAILEGTPIGATLHFMDATVDTGDIVHQKSLSVSPADTADTLYQRIKKLELEVFKDAWAQLVSAKFHRKPQDSIEGTMHKHSDLFQEGIQCIDLEQPVKAGDLIRRLRSLTTNRLEEAAYYEVDGKRYRIQVIIHEEPKSG